MKKIITFYELEQNAVFNECWKMEFGPMDFGAATVLQQIAEARHYNYELMKGGFIMRKTIKDVIGVYEIKIAIVNHCEGSLSGKAIIARSKIK